MSKVRGALVWGFKILCIVLPLAKEMYMCLDVACPLCSTCLQKCSACAPVLSSQCWCAFLSLLSHLCSEKHRLAGAVSRQSHLVQLRRLSGSWRRAAIQKRKYRETGVASYGQADLGKDHLRGSTAVSKRYNGSKSSSRVGCRTDTAEVSRLDFIWTSC